MALIANNGTGKSSMLKIIAGQDISDEGTHNTEKRNKSSIPSSRTQF